MGIPHTPLILLENKLKDLIPYIKNYKYNRFTFSAISSKDSTIEMKIEPIFHGKYIIHIMKQLDEIIDYETTQSLK